MLNWSFVSFLCCVSVLAFQSLFLIFLFLSCVFFRVCPLNLVQASWVKGDKHSCVKRAEVGVLMGALWEFSGSVVVLSIVFGEKDLFSSLFFTNGECVCFSAFQFLMTQRELWIQRPCQRNQDCGESRRGFLFSVSHLSDDSVQLSVAAYSEKNRITTEKPPEIHQIKLSIHTIQI